jgi:hypothetical protein
MRSVCHAHRGVFYRGAGSACSGLRTTIISPLTTSGWFRGRLAAVDLRFVTAPTRAREPGDRCSVYLSRCCPRRRVRTGERSAGREEPP